jgi:hypothetical protein
MANYPSNSTINMILTRMTLVTTWTSTMPGPTTWHCFSRQISHLHLTRMAVGEALANLAAAYVGAGITQHTSGFLRDGHQS